MTTRPATAQPSSRPPSAIGKVVAVVEALADERSTTEIARRTGLPVSTVHRILQELVAVGWAREDGDRGYMLGAGLVVLAGRATDHDTLVRIARPVLQDLSHRTGHTVHFAVRTGDEVVYIDKIEGTRAYQMRSRVGLALSLHCTAIGKALLAQMPEAEVDALLDRVGLPRRTANTITSPELLREHLVGVRKRGYALDDEENEATTRCIGAVVHDHQGRPLAGISLSMLAFELDDARVRTLAPLVVDAARAITLALGGAPRPTPPG